MMKQALFTLLAGLTIMGTIEARLHCTYVFYYQPVCGNNGKTYINPGHLNCEKLRIAGLEMISNGHCPTETSFPTMDAGERHLVGVTGNLHAPQQPNPQEPGFNNGETPTNVPFDDTHNSRTGQMHHGHGNYPEDGWRWDSREYRPDNSFELHIGGGHGGGMGKGLIAGAILGKVASDMSKKKHDKKLNAAGIGSNPYAQQPNPYGQQPNPYGQQPNPYGQQPNPYGHQPNPYGHQPNPSAPQPKPYPVQPNAYNPSGSPSNPTNTNSRPNPYAPSAPAAPAPAPAPAKPASTGYGNSGTNTNSGDSNSGRSRTSSKKTSKSGGGRRKGR